MMTHLALSKLTLLVFAGLLPSLTQAQGTPPSRPSPIMPKPDFTRPYRPQGSIPPSSSRPELNMYLSPYKNDTLTFVSHQSDMSWNIKLKLVPGKSWAVKDCKTGVPIKVKKFTPISSTPSKSEKIVEIVNECSHPLECHSFYIDGWYFGTNYVLLADAKLENLPELGNFYGEKTFGAPAYLIKLSTVEDVRKRVEIGTWVKENFKRATAQYC
jgi:hypothetical protein